MVLVMLSTTVSLYVGMEDLLKNRFPKEIDVAVTNVSEKESEQIKQMIHEEAQKYQMRIKEPIQYRSISFPAYRKGNAFITDRESQQITNLALVELIPLEEYNRLENKNITLEDNEVLLFTFRGKPVKNAIVFGEKEFHIKEELEDLTINGDVAAYVMDSYFVIVKDEQIIKDIYPAEELQVPSLSELSYYYGFDVEGDREQEVTFTKALSHKFQDMPNDVLVEGREDSREAFYSIYGGFLFLDFPWCIVYYGNRFNYVL